MGLKYIILFFIIINGIINKPKEKNSEFITWSITNNIKFHALIEISKHNGTKKIKVKTDIKEKEQLLTIPYDFTFGVTKFLDMLGSKKLREQYDLFKNMNISVYKSRDPKLEKEKIFLSYLLYLIQHEQEKYNRTEFYKKYDQYIKALKDYIPNRSSLFFTQDQLEYLSGSYLGRITNKVKQLFQEEIAIFKNKTFYNKDINYTEYTYNRLFIENKGLEILGHVRLIPLFNYLDGDHWKYNAKMQIENNGDIKIMTSRNIHKNKPIFVEISKKKYIERIIFGGKLNPIISDKSEDYIIPTFSPGLYYKYDISDIELYNTYFINFADFNYDSIAINLYKKYKTFFKDYYEKESWAYGILLENIEFYLKSIKILFKNEKINDIFENEDDRMLIQKTMNGELTGLRKQIKYIKKKYEDLKKMENINGSDL